MNLNKITPVLMAAAIMLFIAGCKTPSLTKSPSAKAMPADFSSGLDSNLNSGVLTWRQFFKDPYLAALIDTALLHNQELAIMRQEIEIASNDIRYQKSRLYPKAEAGLGVGIEKVGRYTSQGAGDASTEITPGKEVPDWLMDYRFGAVATWEADIWKKLRNSKKIAVNRYLSTMEGRNFQTTNLVSEIAGMYYELLALDNQLSIVRQTIILQQNALEIVRAQKEAAAATDLAVKKFESEVLNSQSREYEILQKIQIKENDLNQALGRYPQHILRDTSGILNIAPTLVNAGIPSQLLNNRPDIKQAVLELESSKLDVKVAKAEFYPAFNITAALGFQAFNPNYLVKFPESLLSSLAGDLAGPLINKAAIKTEYANANARQIQAIYEYERTILNAYIEVSSGLSNMQNYEQIFNRKAAETDTLTSSVNIANDLFRSARADYLEVLMTQRDALETKLELVEIRLSQHLAATGLYRALGGGWN